MARGRRKALLSFGGAAMALLLSTLTVSASVFPYGTIVFTSNRDWPTETAGVYEGSDIYAMNPDGSRVTRLTNNSDVERDPVLSPDGTKIAFAKGPDVWVMNADGSDQVNVTACNNIPDDPWRCGQVDHPTWSPGSSQIAFAWRWAGAYPPRWELRAVNVDGTGRSVLSSYAPWLGDPAWSPDGTKIAFAAGMSESASSVYLKTLGTAVNQATQLFPGRMPAWSPSLLADGGVTYYHLAYVGHWFVDQGWLDAAYGDDVYVTTYCDICGIDPGYPYFPASGRDWSPSWSGDGTKIVFQSERWHTPAVNDADAVFHLFVADPFTWDDPYPGYVFVPLDLSVFSAGSGAITYSDTLASWHWPIYDISGLFSPVHDWNGAKAGSAVPIKFSLGGDRGLDIFAAGYPVSVPINCSTDDTTEAAVETVTAGGSSLTYDPVADQYIYVCKTQKDWKGTCREFQLAFQDGTFVTARFSFFR